MVLLQVMRRLGGVGREEGEARSD
ncbi:hypothetical protein SMAC4_13112 [Sordaria macrospora]|nr:hypothetical protein SMAC4_13112 [Sordaria macrospora]